jgi:hypothetical protein
MGRTVFLVLLRLWVAGLVAEGKQVTAQTVGLPAVAGISETVAGLPLRGKETWVAQDVAWVPLMMAVAGAGRMLWVFIRGGLVLFLR